MAYNPVPPQYRKSPEAVVTYDVFDSIGGAFKNFYLLGIQDSTGSVYTLTTDSSIGSHVSNMLNTANGMDLDFDIEVTETFLVEAREAAVSVVLHSDSGTDSFTFAVVHVDSGDTETSIGTITTEDFAQVEGRRTVKIAMTRKRFIKGDKLRLTVTCTANGNSTINYDPTGRKTIGEAGGTNTTNQAIFQLPIEIPR